MEFLSPQDKPNQVYWTAQQRFVLKQNPAYVAWLEENVVNTYPTTKAMFRALLRMGVAIPEEDAEASFARRQEEVELVGRSTLKALWHVNKGLRKANKQKPQAFESFIDEILENT